MTNNHPPAWLIQAKLKSKRLRSDAETTRAGLLAIQTEIAEINLDLRALESRRDSLAENLNGLRSLPAHDERVRYVEGQLAPLLSEIDMIQASLAETHTRQQAANAAAGPTFTLANAAEAALRAVQGQTLASSVGSV